VRRVLLLLITLAATPLALVAAAALPNPAASASTAVFPTVSGQPHATPKIVFPKGKPPTALESKTLVTGHGPLTKKGDLLVANYIGQIWGGKVFDSSYARKQLSGFAIGVGAVIKGWDDTLVGVRIGSELLLVIPPSDSYGSGGNSSAGITGKDDIVFVVDVVAAYPPSSAPTGTATPVSTGTGGVKVTGKIGKVPTISIAKGAKEPKSPKIVLIDRGSGKKLAAGMAVIQYYVVDWKGTVEGSTWAGAGTPYGLNLDLTSGSPFNDLVGLPVGSRVLVELPESDGEGPYAFVADVVAQPADPQPAA
jgi:peptidylprolyl isomerase